MADKELLGKILDMGSRRGYVPKQEKDDHLHAELEKDGFIGIVCKHGRDDDTLWLSSPLRLDDYERTALASLANRERHRIFAFVESGMKTNEVQLWRRQDGPRVLSRLPIEGLAESRLFERLDDVLLISKLAANILISRLPTDRLEFEKSENRLSTLRCWLSQRFASVEDDPNSHRLWVTRKPGASPVTVELSDNADVLNISTTRQLTSLEQQSLVADPDRAGSVIDAWTSQFSTMPDVELAYSQGPPSVFFVNDKMQIRNLTRQLLYDSVNNVG